MSASGAQVNLVLEGLELLDEAVDEVTERLEPGRGPDHELAQPGLDVLLDHPARAVPAGRDQELRIGVRAPATDRCYLRAGDGAVQGDGDAEAEVVVVDVPSGVGGTGLSRGLTAAVLVRKGNRDRRFNG